MAPQSAEPVEVFYSYSHKDERLRNKLDNHLALLQRQNLIKEWHDRMIEAGDDWESEINEHLNSAQIILLLVSDDFIASDYCYSIEMERALERHMNGEARVIPIILRPVDWESSPFGKVRALPKDGKAITKWKNRDEALKNIAQGIRKIIKEFKPKLSQSATTIFIPRPPVVGFVARRDEQGRNIVERLEEELAPQGNQLVTLSGPGGVGKSTLAAEAARALREVFGGRIVWSSAEKRTDFQLSTLLDDSAIQLGHTEMRTLAPELKEAQVRALVDDSPVLIVLDNYETIVPDAKTRIEEWFALAQCSALFTSRHKIDSTRNIPVAAMSREEAQDYLERLVAQTQDEQIFSDDVRRRIYETAEANPYVMQWVVAQIDAAQEPRTVLEELEHGEGDAAQRVFDRSFNLPQLGDGGRAALLALSLFVPSASRNALAEVAGLDNDVRHVREAVKNLHALWLIKTIDEHRRFTIEGLTRSLAKARLSETECADEFRQRFVALFLGYAETHAQPTPEDFDALEAEKDNLLGAMDVAYEMKNWEGVMQIAKILGNINGFLDVRGYWDEAIKRNRQAVEVASFARNELDAAMFSQRVGTIQYRRGLYNEARQANEEALATYRDLKSEGRVAVTLHQLALLAQDQGEVEQAKQLYNESLKINRRLCDNIGIASTLHQLGRLAQDRGEIKEAQRFYKKSLKISKVLGNPSIIASTLHQLGRLAQDQGAIQDARRLYNESLEIKKRLGNPSGIAITLGQLGLLAAEEGDKNQAVQLMNEARIIFEKLKSPYAEVARRNLKRLEGESS